MSFKQSRIYNVRDFGAMGDLVTDDSVAVQACINAAVAAQGVVHFPGGIYYITTALTVNTSNPIRIYGEGRSVSQIYLPSTSNTAIFAMGNSCLDVEITDLRLTGDTSGSVTPPTPQGNNIAVKWPSAGEVAVRLARLDIRGMGENAILVQGKTGTSSIRDCAIATCAGYGIRMIDTGGQSPEDVTVQDVSIHSSDGGISLEGCSSIDILDADIELGGVTTRPCINITDGPGGNESHSNTIVNCSLSVTSGATTLRMVYINAYSCTIIGGLNYARNNATNIYVDSKGVRLVVVGGSYTNGSTGSSCGYMVVTAGTGLYGTYTGLQAVGGFWQAGVKDMVYDAIWPTGRNTCVNVLNQAGAGYCLLDNIAMVNTITATGDIPATHKITTTVNGVTYYLLATT